MQCNWTFQSQFFFSITLIQCVYKFAHVAYHSPMTLYHIFNLLCLPLSLTTTTSPQFNTDWCSANFYKNQHWAWEGDWNKTCIWERWVHVSPQENPHRQALYQGKFTSLHGENCLLKLTIILEIEEHYLPASSYEFLFPPWSTKPWHLHLNSIGGRGEGGGGSWLTTLEHPAISLISMNCWQCCSVSSLMFILVWYH